MDRLEPPNLGTRRCSRRRDGPRRMAPTPHPNQTTRHGRTGGVMLRARPWLKLLGPKALVDDIRPPDSTARSTARTTVNPDHHIDRILGLRALRSTDMCVPRFTKRIHRPPFRWTTSGPPTIPPCPYIATMARRPHLLQISFPSPSNSFGSRLLYIHTRDAACFPLQ